MTRMTVSTSPRRRACCCCPAGWTPTPAHWQSRWEALHGDQRVRAGRLALAAARRLDGAARRGAARVATDPRVLVAHSLGCQLVAAWAAHSTPRGARARRAAGRAARHRARRHAAAACTTGGRSCARACRSRASSSSAATTLTATPTRAAAMAHDWGAQPRRRRPARPPQRRVGPGRLARRPRRLLRSMRAGPSALIDRQSAAW